MAGETVITVVGNLVDDPELRFTPAGVAVAKFRIASTPRVFNREANEWKDGDSLFLTCSVWRQAAENVAESLGKGTRVIVQGRLKQRSYEDREGVKRTVYELDVDEVGPTLARATAKVEKNPAGGGQQQAGDAQAKGNASPDPWAGAKPANGQQQGGGWGGAQQQQPATQGAGYSDEPPF
ncbi:single-stranded DNA-binding protein [Streptomyces bottropensis]|uniref:single-stranded DNA-binding protein n=1 Tax=Streptomyces bottropensis TaxID=42235 RepID=UPI0036C23616